MIRNFKQNKKTFKKLKKKRKKEDQENILFEEESQSDLSSFMKNFNSKINMQTNRLNAIKTHHSYQKA